MSRKKQPAAMTAVIEDEEDFVPDEEMKAAIAGQLKAPAMVEDTLPDPPAPEPPKVRIERTRPLAWKFNIRANWLPATLTLDGTGAMTPEEARKVLHDLLDRAIQGIENTR